jgi:hypothetical protein
MNYKQLLPNALRHFRINNAQRLKSIAKQQLLQIAAHPGKTFPDGYMIDLKKEKRKEIAAAPIPAITQLLHEQPFHSIPKLEALDS